MWAWERRGRRSGQQFQGVVGIQHAAAGDLAGQGGNLVDALQQRAADLRHRGIRVGRPGQGRHAGDLGRRHARAGQVTVLAAGQRAIDIDARRGQVDRVGPVIAERRELVVGIAGGHGDDVRQARIGRILRRHVVVARRVSRRGDEEDPGVAGRLDRRIQAGVALAAASNWR